MTLALIHDLAGRVDEVQDEIDLLRAGVTGGDGFECLPRVEAACSECATCDHEYHDGRRPRSLDWPTLYRLAAWHPCFLYNAYYNRRHKTTLCQPCYRTLRRVRRAREWLVQVGTSDQDISAAVLHLDRWLTQRGDSR